MEHPSPHPQSAAALPPQTVHAEGRRWRVTRAWPLKEQPAKEQGLGVELIAEGQVRAGWFDGEEVTLLPAGADRRLPELESFAAGGTVVSHRPGRRAVVRHRLPADLPPARRRSSPAPEPQEVFTKVVRPGRAERILAGIARAGAFAGPFRTPAVLEAGDTFVTLGAVTGRSLHEPAVFSAEAWEAAWTQVLAAWETAIQDPAGSPGDVPVHDAAAEAAVLRQWASAAGPYLAAGGAARTGLAGPEVSVELLAEAVEQTAAALLELPARRLVPAHRDLHDKQLLFSEDLGPALLDVDTASLADPALDLANLRAHAGWRVRQELWSADQAETVRRAINDAAYRAGVPAAALDLYERATALRLSCLYAFRPGYAEAAARLRADLISESSASAL